jgi:dipeptidyl aminopeptidase/acylaminoacyl peptidase
MSAPPRWVFHSVPILAAAAVCLAQPAPRPAPLSIEALRTARFAATLQHVRPLGAGANFTAELVSYRSGPLTVYALVATPKGPPPPRGFPVLVANHGTHPDPPRYGFTAEGVDSRPGDYYRPIPDLYTAAGFIVVMPDYRGHNTSEGLEQARGLLASAYFTEDVLALLAGLSGIDHADLDNVFMWGHSLGGEVTLRALLATDAVKGASLWSTVGGEIWDQAYYYSRYKERGALDGVDVQKPAVEQLKRDIASLAGPYDWAAREPLRFLRLLRTPLILHHAIGDTGAKYEWSERLAKELYLAGQPYVFHTYPGSDHLFQGPARNEAVARDVAYFRSLMGRLRP